MRGISILEHIQSHPQEAQRLLGIKYEQLEKLLTQAIKLHEKRQELIATKKVRIIPVVVIDHLSYQHQNKSF
ncbi:hypothetical protein ACP6PL_11880 [Dapis sp. BLCC M126]|uniref:hypothetical protein n=1 Tax=Dapis sp. BLCC M126 TaxID=3400189 RepID=UPI003CEB8CE7